MESRGRQGVMEFMTNSADFNGAVERLRHLAHTLTVSAGHVRKVAAELSKLFRKWKADEKARKKQEAIDWFSGLPPWAPERHPWTPPSRASRQAVHSRPVDARYRRGGRGAHNHHMELFGRVTPQ